jgi:hypothetical protein
VAADRSGICGRLVLFGESHATEHAIEFDRPLLRRLLAMPGDLLLDVMGDDD